MPLYLTAAQSSAYKRSNTAGASSPFQNHARTKSTSSSSSRKRKRPLDDADDDSSDEDNSAVEAPPSSNIKPVPFTSTANLQTVPDAITYALSNIFSPVPHRASGLSSTQTSTILNFRRSLPPIISLAHIHALLSHSSSTKIEREIATLITTCTIRKIPVSGRGNSVSGLGEFLIRSSDLDDLIDASAILKPETKTRFKSLLKSNPRATNLSPQTLPDPADLTPLVKAGFLVTASSHGQISSGSAAASLRFSAPVATASRTPSGSLIQVTDSSFENLRSSGATTNDNTSMPTSGSTLLTLSVPNLGPYTRLLSSARTHLLDLLISRSKHSSAPAYLLRERWDGSVDPDTNRVAGAKKLRGEWAGVRPAKTKKWKHLAGLEFRWVLDECLGAGLVEGFETGSVGLGVRVV